MAKPTTNSSIGIMVDLDSILDTRKGTIKKLFPEVYEEIKNSPKYHLRKEDRWDTIDKRLDNSRITLNYQGRNIETIRHSQLTMVSRMILELVNNLTMEVGGNNPEISRFFLVVNLYPYKLPEDFKIEFCRLLGHQLGLLSIPIGIVEKPFSELNPGFLKENNIRFWYCYHFGDWLKENFEPIGTEEINKDSIIGYPECKIFAPMISQDQKGIDDFLASIHDCPYANQFELTRSVMSNIIQLEFSPVSSFCQIDADKLKQLEKEGEMERSEVLSVPETATNELMKRLGEYPEVSKERAEGYLDELEQLICDLRIFNTEPTFSLFKSKLAMLNFTVSKLYNSVPFNSGIDLEQLLDSLSLSVDTSIEDFDKTEQYWNEKGVSTIRREEESGTGETIYRCVAVEAYPDLEIKKGQFLTSTHGLKSHVSPADGVNFLGYFGNGK